MGKLNDLAEHHETRFILALFTTLTGKPCAKLVPVESAQALEDGELGFAGFAAGAMGQVPKDPDILAVPDLSTFTPLDFLRPGLALVHCDPHCEGEPWHFAPRIILRKVLDRAAQAGYVVKAGAELEYFLVKRDQTGRSIVLADPDDRAPSPCYDVRDVTRMFDHLAEVSEAMNALGWGNYANDHEDGNGQFEQNFTYDEAMVTADRTISLRYMTTMIAEKRDMIATYMPKPFQDRTGNGLHFHMSLWDGDQATFPGGDDAGETGLSRLGDQFLGGVLEHARALQAVLAPSVNSYKRTRSAATTSGAAWTPNHASWGGNDRTHYVRVPDDQRIELRSGDGAANPYLALAASIAAGLDGIERDLDPGPSGRSDAAEMPPTLLHAVEELRRDDVVRGALDAAGEGVADYFADLKQAEFMDYHSVVTDWEIEHYLRAF